MAGGGGTRVVIVEDHVGVAKALELLLARLGFEVVGVATGSEDGERLVKSLHPQVAIVDLDLPRENGARLTRRLLERDPGLRVLIYTGVRDRHLLAQAVNCGAHGFALKAGGPHDLYEAVRTVAAGGRYVDPRLRSALLARETTNGLGILSPREREVLDAIARGMTGEETARSLAISSETVRTHVRNAMQKLEAHTRAHAVAIALREGEIEP
jgi:DNA-binding NarL/FixJ family response regulator